MINYFYLNCNFSFFICELQTIWEKVEENLFITTLITVDRLNEIQVAQLVNFSHKLNVLLIGARNQDLESLVDGVPQIEVILLKLERIVFQFG